MPKGTWRGQWVLEFDATKESQRSGQKLFHWRTKFKESCARWRSAMKTCSRNLTPAWLTSASGVGSTNKKYTWLFKMCLISIVYRAREIAQLAKMKAFRISICPAWGGRSKGTRTGESAIFIWWYFWAGVGFEAPSADLTTSQRAAAERKNSKRLKGAPFQRTANVRWLCLKQSPAAEKRTQLKS